MKILVAGKGFIGSESGKKLAKEHEVKYLDRDDADYEKDITKEFQIEEEFDLIIHTIGLAPAFNSEKDYRDVHVEGTKNLLNAVDADKIIYLSALGVGEVDHSFFKTKQKAEEIIKKSDIKHTILRPSTVYGPGNQLLEYMKKTAFTRVFPNIKTKTQPIQREDLIKVITRVTESRENETLDIAGPQKITIGELGCHLYNEKGYSCLLIPMPQFLLELSLVGLSPFPPPFQRENIQILRADNTTEENAAKKMIELTEIF